MLHLKHDDTGNDCQCGEHNIVYRRDNGSIEGIKGLKHEKQKKEKALKQRND